MVVQRLDWAIGGAWSEYTAKAEFPYKSQTMLGNTAGCGLIATAITWLYKGVSEHRQRTKARFGIRVSALELTNRRRDLLASYASGPASRSRLHLIDLGGGVNVEQKLGRGEMILPPSAIGNILLAILNGHKHLPHRDQIVTQTLKQCLGSLRCQAVIIAHISTAKMHQTDTIATVQLASRIHRLRRRRFKVGHPSQADDAERSPVETVDPSSSEQSADTVIYVGPGGETETDGEHPPIYMSRLLPPGSPQRSISKNSSRSTKSSPCKSKSKPLLDGGEEQWVDGPKISKSRLVEARNQLLQKDKRGHKEMWVDGPASHVMDFSKRSMIRKWVENQTMQTQSRRRDKEKGKYKEMTVFKTCEDRGRASGQEDSAAEEEAPVTATATETPAAQRSAEIGKVVPIQRLQAIGQDMPEPEKPSNDNHEIELDNGDDLDEKSDTSSDQKEIMLDVDEDIITDEDDEIIIVEEPTELVPMQDCCLQVTEEDIALSMGEYIENPLPEVDQEDHPLKLLSEENLSVMSSLGDQGRLERWQSLSDLCPPEDDTASILSEPLYHSDGVYCQNCRLNITPSRNHVHLNSLNRLSKSISLLRHPDGSSNPNLSKLDDGWSKSNELDLDHDNKFKDEFDALSIPPLPPLQSTMISLSSAGFKCTGRSSKPSLWQV
ncbi:kinesin-like protein CG14535 [Nilaparvata lugens]|uniref:kinesin-like protein CG14535 n=1 Tax=Nilaparvata lugens TaxID=108931 RepID=UPI00193D3967|nr:kinesin-like protein CG14535 [Nilaparvata lugens]